MKIYAFPADMHGCGSYRIIWPSEQLKLEGWDIDIVLPGSRDRGLRGVMDDDGFMKDVIIPEDADLMVFQRVSHVHIAQAIELIRAKGVAVVVEIDDDLTCIDPRNPAFDLLKPGGLQPEHSWRNTLKACEAATMVVVSTPALLKTFARHGRGRVYDNYIQRHLLDIPRVDHDLIGWAGSVHSHPGDLQVMGSSINRLAQEGYQFANIGNGIGVREAWGIGQHVPLHCTGVTDPGGWGQMVAKLGVGVAPLADTKFNAAKSWLKMAEMAAVGVPCVGSPRAEYSRLHERGVGTLARNEKEWYRKVKILASSPAARQEMSEQGRAIMAGMTVEGNAWRLGEIWAEAFELSRS